MLEFHPLANLFPLIEGAAFDELVADIKANGLNDRIVFTTEGVLDGRNRYRALLAAGLMGEDDDTEDAPGNFVVWGPNVPGWKAGGDPTAWVLGKNLHRRHLTESQRALIAADLGKLRQGRPSEWNNEREDKPANLRDKPDLTAKQRADMLGISERQVQTGDFVKEHAAPEVAEAVRRGEVKVSAAAELAKLSVEDQTEILRSADPRAIGRVARERQQVGHGARSVMSSRVEPPDSLDYFPTPPWATRALIEDVLAKVETFHAPGMLTVWEPACGEGHISGVLEEYFGTVIATDIFDYSTDGRSAPGWAGKLDFLGTDSAARDLVEGSDVDWIITNTPFAEGATLEFALRAIKLAKRGVALFVRQQWLEGVDRYERLFRDTPPTIYAQFAERVNLCKGRWDPEGSTATAYCWLVFIKGEDPRPTFWIPPGRRVERSRPDDVERFTAHPVRGAKSQISNDPEGSAADGGEGGVVGTGALSVDAARLAYTEALAASGVKPGHHTRPTAAPIVAAAYACDPIVPTKQLAADLGHPIGTVLTWASRLGLTDTARRQAHRFTHSSTDGPRPMGPAASPSSTSEAINGS